jgi:hypothetical protein
MLSVGEERAGFSGIFEIVAADKAGGGQKDATKPAAAPRTPAITSTRSPRGQLDLCPYFEWRESHPVPAKKTRPA